MERRGCHVWCGPNPSDICAAHRQAPQSPEVWVAADHPELHLVELWSGSTVHTVGPGPPPLVGPFVIHHGVGLSLELLTLDRPRHTVVIPWPYPSVLSPGALS